MAPDLHLIFKALRRLNPWIAALLVVALLQYQQVSLHTSLVDQISAQPANVLTAAPKFALAKPAPPEMQVRLIPLIDAMRAALPPHRPGSYRVATPIARAVPPPQPSHGWHARAPPALLVSVHT